MEAWRRWLATSAPAGEAAPTWEEWRVRQRRLLSSEQRQPRSKREYSLFSERELARLTFVRWLQQRGARDLEPAPRDSDDGTDSI